MRRASPGKEAGRWCVPLNPSAPRSVLLHGDTARPRPPPVRFLGSRHARGAGRRRRGTGARRTAVPAAGRSPGAVGGGGPRSGRGAAAAGPARGGRRGRRRRGVPGRPHGGAQRSGPRLAARRSRRAAPRRLRLRARSTGSTPSGRPAPPTASPPDDTLTAEQRAERGDYVGCIAGALSFAEYRTGLEGTEFTDIAITATHPVADGMHSDERGDGGGRDPGEGAGEDTADGHRTADAAAFGEGTTHVPALVGEARSGDRCVGRRREGQPGPVRWAMTTVTRHRGGQERPEPSPRGSTNPTAAPRSCVTWPPTARGICWIAACRTTASPSTSARPAASAIARGSTLPGPSWLFPGQLADHG
ncbi:hypothetical protein SHL15_7852 [Streptomyces hygroscopicus subsp. limoneus]|nr:hypothetical protein SHL15_7852 [Streptomyces hygroscopicus subsp. limoneus]